MDRLHAIPRKYVVARAESGDLPPSSENYELLKTFRRNLQKLIRREKSISDRLEHVSLLRIHPPRRALVAVLDRFLFEAEEQYYSFLSSAAGEVVTFAASLMTLLKANREYNVRAAQFVADM
jgi:hypothetical protein